MRVSYDMVKILVHFGKYISDIKYDINTEMVIEPKQ